VEEVKGNADARRAHRREPLGGFPDPRSESKASASEGFIQAVDSALHSTSLDGNVEVTQSEFEELCVRP